MKNFFVITALLICTTIQLNAQTVLVSTDKVQKNFIKVNLTSIILKNYSIQYERVLNKTISVSLSFRDMPTTTLPFKNQILKQMGSDNTDAQDIVENLTLGNYAITPELRFYLGKKGYGRGFYIAPFYRYAKYNAGNVVVNYDTDQTPPQQRSIDLSGNITAHTGGIMFGAQWSLGKHLCLDWWILGPHYGVSSGGMNGVPSQQLTTQEQSDIRQNLEDLNIPMVKQTVEVSANKVAMVFDGPWAGIRAGISIGFKF